MSLSVFRCGCLALMAFAGFCEGREVVFRRMDGNASPLLTQTIAELRDGDTLRFETGDYHFHTEGTTSEYLVTVGCWNGDKDVVFLLDGLKDVTIDGGGSTFYWHGRVYPFHFRNCTNLTVGNFSTTMAKKSIVELKVVENASDGFLCRFQDPSCYRVEDRRILFDTDIGLFSTAWAKISMHALDRTCINYLFAGDCTNAEARVNMPAAHIETYAEDRGGGQVFFRYRNDIPGGSLSPYRVGEPMCFLLEIPRFRTTFLFDVCRNATLHDATVQFGGGIAFAAQLCEDLTIERFKVKPRDGEFVANTADCMFLVNCRGSVRIRDCEISRSLDDALNCHGCYLTVTRADGRTATLRHVMAEHYDGFFPYPAGDRVEFTHPQSRTVLGVFTVAAVGDYTAYSPEVTVTFEEELPQLPVGAFAENLTWIPDVTVSGCHFHDTLHLRLSGRGHWLVENNLFERFGGIVIDDLASYWGEAGWAQDMTIRHNHFSGGGTYVSAPASSPRRNQGVRVVENTYWDGTLASLPGVIGAEVAGNELRATPKEWPLPRDEGTGWVTNVVVSSRADDRVVTIDYELTGESAIVTADILTNEVSIGAANCSSMVGDVNRLVQPGRRRIVWLPCQSWPNQRETEPRLHAALTLWSADDPPPYMAVWLWQNRKVNWYASAESLPGGLMNELYRENCLVMARIPAAGVTWRMGSVPGEATLDEDPVASIRLDNERLHDVTLTNDFYMGVYPITQGQWRMMKSAFTVEGRPDLSQPANGISYNDLRGSVEEEIDWPSTGHAVSPDSYIGLLRAKTGLAFDLPTDAEWEFACRAGCAGPFFNGKDAEHLDEMAWYDANSGGVVHLVGEKEPNAWGLYDMVGNVSAWCLDWIEKPMPATAVTAPVGAATGTERARRGGNWLSPRYHLRSGLRGSDYPNDDNEFFGGRLVVPLSEVRGL